jgi:PAS domain S-box-containing protein
MKPQRSGVVITDGDGRLVGWSDGAVSLLGPGLSEGRGQPVEEVIAPDISRASLAGLLRALGSGDAHDARGRSWDLPLLGADGAVGTYHVIADRTHRADGSEVIILAIEETPAASGWAGPAADLLRTLFDRAPEIITVNDPDGHQRMVNPAGLELLGFDPSFQTPPDGLAFVHPEDQAMLEERRARIRAGEPMLDPARFRVRRADGEWRWLEMLVADLSDVPEVQARVSFSRDVTDSEERARALQISSVRLSALVENFRGPAVLNDEHGEILHANRAFAELVELASDGGRAGGPDVASVLGELMDPAAARDLRDVALAARGEGRDARFDIDLLDGRVFEVAHVSIGDRGAGLGELWLLSDVSERRADARRREELLELERAARGQAEVQSELLRRADDARNEFLSSLSHELRTPLTSIASATELLLSDADDLAPQMASHLAMIGRNAERLHRIVEDLLLVGRLGEGMLEIEPIDLPLQPVVVEAVAALQPMATQAGVEVRVVVPGDAAARVDSFRLSQVVSNLVANAIQHSPRGGRVDVHVDVGATIWRLVVDDEGPGIPAADRTAVFERFRRLGHGAHSLGAGLGLAIVRGMVELHGGSVRIDDAPAGGARVVCTFPVAGPSGAVGTT